MTISTTDNRANYVGNGVITQFSFGFRTLDDTHIYAYLDAVAQGSGFTVTRNADQDTSPGGVVDFAVAPAADELVTLERIVPFTQETDYTEYDPFPAETHETALDTLTMQTQQNADAVDRSMRLSIVDDGTTDTELPVYAPNTTLVWDGTVKKLVNSSAPGASLDGIYTFDTVALMKDESLVTGLLVQTRGYYTSGDSGYATYLIKAPQTFDGYGDHELANSNIAVLQYSGLADVRQFGAVVDGVGSGGGSGTDDYNSIAAALAASDSVIINGGICVSQTMITLTGNQTLELAENTGLLKTSAAGNTDPIVWVKGTGACFKGNDQYTSFAESNVKSPRGVVRIGFADMVTTQTENINYCQVHDMTILGDTGGGQTSGDPDICIYIPNPQFGGGTEYTSYFHRIFNLRLGNANYGMHLQGWANGNIIYSIQGIALGNTTYGDNNGMIWFDGALDNSIWGMFFHASSGSTMLKLTQLDNTGAPNGRDHKPHFNTCAGLVAEQGGAGARGIWSDYEFGNSYIEMRHNTAGGNIVPVDWYDNNTLHGNSGTPIKTNFEADETQDLVLQWTKPDGAAPNGQMLIGKSAIAAPRALAELHSNGTFVQDQSSFKTYEGTGAITITVNHAFTLTGAANYSAVVQILYSGIEAGGTGSVTASYLVPIYGATTWIMRTPISVAGGTLTITSVTENSTTTIFTVQGSATSNCSIQAIATGFRNATLT